MHSIMNILIVIGFLATFVIAGKICKVMNRNTFGTTQAYVRRYVVVWAVVLFVYGAILEFTGIVNYWDSQEDDENNVSISTETTAYTEMVFDDETQAVTEYSVPEDMSASEGTLEHEEPTAAIENTDSVQSTQTEPLAQEFAEPEETYTPPHIEEQSNTEPIMQESAEPEETYTAPQIEEQADTEPITQESAVPEETYISPQTEAQTETKVPTRENFEGVWLSEGGGSRMDIVQLSEDTYSAKMYRPISENEMKYWELNASFNQDSDNRLDFDGTYYVLISENGTYVNQDTGLPVDGYMTINYGHLIWHYTLKGGFYQEELYRSN